MPAVPARTRSLRKPATGSTRSVKPTAELPAETPQALGNLSPSRLPKPPSSTAAASASSSRTTNISRPLTSTSTGNINGSGNGNGNGNGSGSTLRPSSQRIGVSRPPLTSDNKTLFLRSGARTPTEANSSLQRAPSARHTRNSSTSALPSRPSSSGGGYNTSTRAQLFPSSASTFIRPPSSASTSTQSTRQDNKPGTHRPAFSTLQQHFSPARSLAPKPPTSTFLAPPSPSKLPAAIAASAETARLQAELLQLHLLHRSAAPVYTQFCCSARTKLRARFEDVRVAHEALAELEAVESHRRNVRALKAWADDAAPGWGLEEKTQTLDQVLSAAWKLSEPGGRYVRVVKRFERWLQGVARILEARKQVALPGCSGSQTAAEGVEEDMFVEELDADWKDELQSLSRKLARWTQQLNSLGELPSHVQGSNLARIVRGVGELVQGMVDEVKAMERIERGVAAAEEDWIRQAVEEDDVEDGEYSDEVTTGAVWRMY